MNTHKTNRAIGFLSIFLLFGTFITPLSMTQIVYQKYGQSTDIYEGQILFGPRQSTTTYLIDYDGVVNHTWSSNYKPGESVYMLEDGTILRAIKLSLSGGGTGGGIQKISWDGSLIWDFRCNTSDYLNHHDIEPLPNGNVLIVAWENKSRDEAIAAGRDPNKLDSNILNPDHVIEIKPTGVSSGNIVWEWHVWDHLIQDFDPTKDNYGVIEDHPELIDINFGITGPDWLHTNSIDYNEEFDQILLSVHNFHEIWVIDHSTTTEEAAGHTGGKSGKGGDIMYRWGNPRAYLAGTTNDQKFFAQHDARWIKSGYPGGGNILVFNNGYGRPGTDYTSIDEIKPPVDESGNYTLIPGQSYGPEKQTWIYKTNFFAWYLGSVQRLPNGNTIFCNGPAGEFTEVTPEKEIVWEYKNPYPNPFTNEVFKFIYYDPQEVPPDEPDLYCGGSLDWIDVEAGRTLHGDFQVKNIGDRGSLLEWYIYNKPKWGNWTFTPESGEDLTPEDGALIINVTVIAPNKQNEKYTGTIRINNKENTTDYCTIDVELITLKNKLYNINLLFQRFLEQHPNLFPMLRQLLGL